MLNINKILPIRDRAAPLMGVNEAYFPSTENARNTFPAITGNREYPAFAYSIPPTIVGPVPLIAPPLALIPFTVMKSCSVSKSQMILPLAVSYPRKCPSSEPANTTPGIKLVAPGCAALHPLVAKQAGAGAGVVHRIFPLAISTATTPPPASGFPGFQSEIE